MQLAWGEGFRRVGILFQWLVGLCAVWLAYESMPTGSRLAYKFAEEIVSSLHASAQRAEVSFADEYAARQWYFGDKHGVELIERARAMKAEHPGVAFVLSKYDSESSSLWKTQVRHGLKAAGYWALAAWGFWCVGQLLVWLAAGFRRSPPAQ